MASRTRLTTINWRRRLEFVAVLLYSSLFAIAILTTTTTSAATTSTGANSRIENENQMSLSDAPQKSTTPVIGVLTEVLRDYLRFTNTHHLFIASSYVKWLESAGAQVVPILLNQNESYYETMFKQTNGLLFPGGDNLLDPNKDTPMMVAAKKMYKLAVEANDNGDFYPIWGTCLGLELLSVLSSNKNMLEDCSAVDTTLPLQFATRGKMFAPSCYPDTCPSNNPDFSNKIIDLLRKEGLTYNYHHKCLTDEGLRRANLDKFYRPLAYSNDKNNNKFIAIFEAIKYPFYGVQFHPEKPPFEFAIGKTQKNVPHSRKAIAVSRYFADFFVGQAQLNGHKPIEKELQNKYIYAFTPMYTALKNDLYEQRYLFPFGSETNVDLEEFIEHIPAEGEEVPEDVLDISSMSEGTLIVGNIDFKLAQRESIENDLFVSY